MEIPIEKPKNTKDLKEIANTHAAGIVDGVEDAGCELTNNADTKNTIADLLLEDLQNAPDAP